MGNVWYSQASYEDFILLWHEGKCLLRRAAEVEICELGHVLAVIPVCPSSGEW